MSDSKKTVIATLISDLFHPILLVIISMVYLTNRYANDIGQVVRWLSVGLILIVIGPTIGYFFTAAARSNKIDIDISNRADRLIPLMIASLGALIGGYIVSTRLHIPSLLLVSNVLVAMLLVLTLTTFVWKISIHASTLMVIVTLMVIFRGPTYLPLYLLILPVGWARIYLKQHTIAQLIAGSTIGIVVTYIAALILRGSF